MSMKPLKPKPSFYALIYSMLQQAAYDNGYNLLLHGSMNRDIDLVAVPWVDEPKSHLTLLQSLQKQLSGLSDGSIINDRFFKYENDLTEQEILERYYLHKELPGGRSAYIINMNRGGDFNGYVDEQYYLDISITPLLNSKH